MQTTVHPDGRIIVDHGHAAAAIPDNRPVELATDMLSMGLLDLSTTDMAKAAEEQRFTLGLAYPVNRLDVARARDGRRDYATPSAVEQGCWNWMTKSREIGLFHSNMDGVDTTGHAEVVENYIWRCDTDWIIKAVDGSEQRITKGDWLMGAIWDPPGYALVKSQMVNGWSPFGRMAGLPADAADIAGLRG